MEKLATVGARFLHVKEVGEVGHELITNSEKVIANMRKVVATFEEGMTRDSWNTNIAAVGGEEALECSTVIYSALKEALAKIDKVI